jgi:hypothetical protein
VGAVCGASKAASAAMALISLLLLLLMGYSLLAINPRDDD